MNFVTNSIKSRDSPPPPPPPNDSNTNEDVPKPSEGVEEDSLMYGLFDNYLTCNLNVADEIEAWMEETRKFQDSVHCS